MVSLIWRRLYERNAEEATGRTPWTIIEDFFRTTGHKKHAKQLGALLKRFMYFTLCFLVTSDGFSTENDH